MPQMNGLQIDWRLFTDELLVWFEWETEGGNKMFMARVTENDGVERTKEIIGGLVMALNGYGAVEGDERRPPIAPTGLTV